MNDRITQSLTKLFEKHRIVFWYDAKQELRQEFEAIALDGIEKIELKNNEFGVNYRILRQQPKGKFLLYHEGPQPALFMKAKTGKTKPNIYPPIYGGTNLISKK